jgi:CubicO group peptidase (beta-lactamase class C family)
MIRRVLPLLAFTLAAAVTDHPDVAGQQRLFDTWMKGQMAYRNLPGVAIGVVSDQQLVWAKGFGYADVDAKIPITPQTKFRMASHSKLFTATSIMQLRDQGKLRLDDPVSKHLPWFKVPPVEEGDAEITINELLTHSSGLSREAGAHWTELKFPDAQGVRDYIASNKAIYSPEVRWKYSNLAYTIAGMIVEAVSGEKYADYVQKHIFDPLGMSNSSVDKDVPGIAVGYGRRMPDGSRMKFGFVDARAMGPATGITSTVEDMAKFVSAQFRTGKPGGAQILSTAALREMHRVRMMENDWSRGYAVGFAVTKSKDKLYVGHGGSYPGFKTQTLIQIDDKVGVIVLTNGDDSEPADLAQKLMDTVGKSVADAAKAKAVEVSWDPSWSRFAGLYRSRMGESAVVELNKRLVSFNPASPNPEQQNKLVPIGNGQFKLEAPAGGGAVGEVVKFVEVNGKLRMYTGGSYFDKVENEW